MFVFLDYTDNYLLTSVFPYFQLNKTHNQPFIFALFLPYFLTYLLMFFFIHYNSYSVLLVFVVNQHLNATPNEQKETIIHLNLASIFYQVLYALILVVVFERTKIRSVFSTGISTFYYLFVKLFVCVWFFCSLSLFARHFDFVGVFISMCLNVIVRFFVLFTYVDLCQIICRGTFIFYIVEINATYTVRIPFATRLNLLLSPFFVLHMIGMHLLHSMFRFSDIFNTCFSVCFSHFFSSAFSTRLNFFVCGKFAQFRRGVSYAMPNDPNVKNSDRSDGIWMALHRCAFDNDGSAHRNGQISIHILPMNICRVFRLQLKEKIEKKERKNWD